MYMENVKENYWRYSLITIILGLGVILFFKITPFLGGILGAFTIYILLRGQMFHLTEKLNMRPAFAALLLLGETILCFLIPITLAIWLVINKTQNINLDPTVLLNTGQHIADLVQEKTGFDVLDRGNLLKAASILPQIGQFLVGSISSFAVNVVVLIFILYFMLIGGQKMEQYISDILPFNKSNTDHVVREIKMIVHSNAVGIPLLAIIQGGVAMIGYWFFDVPDILLTGFLTCLATVIPMVGTALVWFPIAVYMALSGDLFNGIGLAIFGTLIISQLDNLIRFILQKRMADIHPLITIFGVVIGLSLFGFMGVIFGPLLLSLFFLFVDMFKREYLDKSK